MEGILTTHMRSGARREFKTASNAAASFSGS
jgi:hypothetical protein